MKFKVQYVPLSKIKPGGSPGQSKRWPILRAWMRDCLHVLVVRRNRKDGSYTLLGGRDRYEFLLRHTKMKHAPCIVDERGVVTDVRSWLDRKRNRQLLDHFPQFRTEKLEPAGSRIIRSFLRREPRFSRLTPSQRVKVLARGIRYKRTVIGVMKSMVDEMLAEQRR